MRFSRFLLLLLGLTTGLCSRATAGNVDYRVLSERNGEITVELIDRSPAFRAAIARFFVAISDSGSFSVVTNLPAGGTTVTGLRVEGPVMYRGTRTLFIEQRQIPPRAFGRNPTVTVTYTVARATQPFATADPMLRHLVVNRSIFPARPPVERTDPWLSRAPRWVHFRIATRGMYTITGADLQRCGVDPATINNPSTIRLYTDGGREQRRSFADTSGSWRDGHVMSETAISVDDGGDGVFNVGDRIIFYALGGEGWANYYDSTATDTAYYQNTYTSAAAYWLTWDASLPGVPLRMAQRDATPGPGPVRTTWRYREYHERDLVSNFRFRGDGWIWLNVLDNRTRILDTVNVIDLVSSRPAVFRTGAMSNVSGPGHHCEYTVSRGGSVIAVGGARWNTFQRWSANQVPVRIEGNFLADGANTFRYRMPRDVNTADETYFEWYAVEYERRIRAIAGRVAFDTPDTSVEVTARADDLPPSGALRAYDVTNPWRPTVLGGFSVATQPGGTRSITLSTGPAGAMRHVEISTTGALRHVAVLSCAARNDVRAQGGPVNMLIIAHPSLRSAANILAAYRRTHLPGYTAPVVRVLTTDEVYDNFSAGVTEPMAIRNAIRFFYDHHTDAHGNPTLAYVLLLGDASDDFRNRVSPTPNLVPTVLNLQPASQFTYVTDAFYSHLDAGDQIPGRAVADVAVGRIPASGTQEATAAVNRVIDYETRADNDAWRKQVILVADDEISSFPACEVTWTEQSEALDFYQMSDAFDVKKIYLTEYPIVSGIKPEARQAFINAWNQGALAINYIGHGSNRQMADEIVFVDTDVNVLHNGLRRPIFTALSCTIGQFANPSEPSLTEKLLFRAEGGIIGAITAANESFSTQNNVLNNALYQHMAPRRAGGELLTFGATAMESMFESLAAAGMSSGQEDNNWKYNLFGDPAMTLDFPRQDIRFDATQGDSLVAGLRTQLIGAVYRDGVVDSTFAGKVRVEVREPMKRRHYITRCRTHIPLDYILPGGLLFDGTADVVAGRFSVSYRVPRFAARGTLSQASAFAWSPVTTAGGTEDSLFQVVAPTLADSAGLVPIDGPPRVSMRFKSGLESVKPGETVQAFIHDSDGISILETTNEGRQAILFDNVPVPIEANPFFKFTHGGSDTSGVLEYPLPDLGAGPHRMIYKVADNFGQITLDTLRFDVTDPLDYRAEVVLNYPNPFRDETRFLVRLSDPARVQFDIFTVSGRRIRRLQADLSRGEQWVHWDGRDAVGDRVANGSYLYVCRVRFTGLDRPETVLRGALMKIR